MKKYLREVESRLKALKPPVNPSKWKAESYIGGGKSKLLYLNIKIPRVRAEYKKGFSFSKLPEEQQWKIWDYIWNHSDIFEVMLLSSYWVASRPFAEVFAHRQLVLHWVNRVDNWAHSDELSAHYAKLLEHNADVLMPVFKKWNVSKNPWLRRQSMVGLLFYSRFRKKIPTVKTLLPFIERHLDDEHYYVQKGLGWALRETWNVYPRETFMFLKQHAAKIPPAGWTAATEKLSTKDKQILTKIRGAARRN